MISAASLCMTVHDRALHEALPRTCTSSVPPQACTPFSSGFGHFVFVGYLPNYEISSIVKCLSIRHLNNVICLLLCIVYSLSVVYFNSSSVMFIVALV